MAEPQSTIPPVAQAHWEILDDGTVVITITPTRGRSVQYRRHLDTDTYPGATSPAMRAQLLANSALYHWINVAGMRR